MKFYLFTYKKSTFLQKKHMKYGKLDDLDTKNLYKIFYFKYLL